MTTIPANLFARVLPSVLTVAGNAIDMIALMLTTSTRVPVGTVLPFPDAPSVSDYFGASSVEVAQAAVYFAGFTNADALPGSLLFAQYNQSAVAAYLRGGDAAAALTLAQLQALSGSLTVVIDGYSHVIASISLAAETSFSSAAASLQAAFTDPTESSFTASIGASVTGAISGTTLTISAVSGGLVSVGDAVGGAGVTAGTVITALGSGTGGTGTYTVNHSQSVGSEALTISSNVLDVTVDTDHTIAVGQTVTGSGVAAGTLITAQLTGTAGQTGTYSISGSPQQVASEAMTGVATAPTVTFDSVSGAFKITSGITGAPSTAAFATGTLAAPLLLTSATGAVRSQGAAAAVPAAFMSAIVTQTTDWVTFMTIFDPDGSGNSVKQAFAAWVTLQNDRYAYVCWDTDVTPSESVPATGSLGYILKQNGNSGTILIYAPDATLASFACGAIASIDFEKTNGRTTLTFRNQAGIEASVTTSAAAVNLGGNPQTAGSFGNGYNYYGAVGSANSNFQWFQRGSITGPFAWADSYINQVWLNNQFQLALLTLLNNVKSIPYNPAGSAQIESALADAINAGLNFGAFAPGTISAAQAAQVNADAGASVAQSLQTQGYYLQVLQASSAARASRTSPPCKFWYLDRGSVQSISLDSVALQ